MDAVDFNANPKWPFAIQRDAGKQKLYVCFLVATFLAAKHTRQHFFLIFLFKSQEIIIWHFVSFLLKTEVPC